MARSPFAATVLPIRPPDPERLPDPMDVVLPGDADQVSEEQGALKTELGDGSAIIDLSGGMSSKARSDKFSANLAKEMEDVDLNRIANELLEGIQQDDQSRQEWLTAHAEGIKQLGLVIEDSKSGTAETAIDGMSTARNPLLLEACLMFQANARGEMLPAAGPCKVRDDRPEPPPASPMLGHNGGPPLDSAMAAPGAGGVPAVPPGALAGPGMPPVPPGLPPGLGAPPLAPAVPMPPPDAALGEHDGRDALAAALEKDFNHYLTVTAQEYVPDTDRMLFNVGFGGQGVKKVYNCPIRRRPVSESINIEDFIVSNAVTDLGNAARVTHRIKMRPSTLKRMQLLGVYRDVAVGEPTGSESPNAVDQIKAEVSGVQPQVNDPKDADYIVYECYCELDLDAYAPPRFKGKGLPLPYRVTIEKDSQKVLDIRRNWKEDDEQALAREFFVEFPYVKAFGWYGIGLLHILGNTTKTLTTAERELIDSGMFSNFPGFIYAKGAGRQLTNQFRVGPGAGIGLDVGLAKLSDAVMPLPYKDLGPAFTAFLAHVEERGQRLGGVANMNIGEGRQDAPVGTTLALIDQATKPVGAVLKRLHQAQGKELQLLKERFREDPEAFWRYNPRPAMPWQKEQFVKALSDFDLVPVSDPNNPTSMHRAAKASALQMMAQAAPQLFDLRKVVKRVARGIEVDDIDDLLAPPMPPAPPPVDQGKLATAQAKEKGDALRAQTEVTKAQLSAKTAAEDREARIRELEIKLELEMLRNDGRRDAEETKIAGQLATSAERAHQADRHKALDIVSQHHLAEGERAHRAEIADKQLKARKPVTRRKSKDT